MDDKEIQSILITLLRSALCECPLDANTAAGLSRERLVALFRLAKRHDLSHVISEVIYRNNIAVDEGLRLRLQQKHYASVCRCEQMKYAMDQIVTVFENEKIDYVILKGAVLRSYYPVDSMRTSCDIDILIREPDLDRAVSSLELAGYRREKKHYHDVSLYAPNGSHLELHFNIQENRKNLDGILKDAWRYTVPGDRAGAYAFTDAFFVFHMYAHMAYHFMRGGCGIRSVMDLWVMKHKMGLDWAMAEPLLKKAGIDRFAREMSRLAEQCFTACEVDDFSEKVLHYILMGGVYGSTKNHMAVRKTKANGTFSYMLERLFLPMDGMASTYPILKKAPILLPFCWVARWFGMVFGGKVCRAVEELGRANMVSESQMRDIREIFSRLEL